MGVSHAPYRYREFGCILIRFGRFCRLSLDVLAETVDSLSTSEDPASSVYGAFRFTIKRGVQLESSLDVGDHGTGLDTSQGRSTFTSSTAGVPSSTAAVASASASVSSSGSRTARVYASTERAGADRSIDVSK